MTIDKGIKKYGRSVYVTDGDWSSSVYSAFVQPLRYKNKMYMSGEYTELGHYSEGYYLYIGPVKHDLTALGSSAVLHTADGNEYSVQRAEKVYLGEEPVYIWAVIRERVK